VLTVIVLCQKRALASAWLAANAGPFTVILDEDRSIAKRWGVHVWISYDSLRMARPASFLVDPQGRIAYARISKHQMDPAPMEEIFEAVESVVSGRAGNRP